MTHRGSKKRKPGGLVPPFLSKWYVYCDGLRRYADPSYKNFVSSLKTSLVLNSPGVHAGNQGGRPCAPTMNLGFR